MRGHRPMALRTLGRHCATLAWVATLSGGLLVPLSAPRAAPTSASAGETPPALRATSATTNAASGAGGSGIADARLVAATAKAGGPEEIAFSIPRLALNPQAPAGLPQPLSRASAARLAQIFALQAKGDMAQAARETARLEDTRLLGVVLADRYLRDPDAATPAALQSWLGHYADLPDAGAIYTLLAKKTPAGAALPPPPSQPGVLAANAEVVPEEATPAAISVTRNASLDKSVQERARSGKISAALALVASSHASPAYAALLKADIAEALFQAGEDRHAFEIASAAARHPAGTGQAAYVAGLAAWGLHQWATALPYFESAARAEGAPQSLRAAAAFWTARAAVRSRQPELYVPWMTKAAQEQRTFYGLVARRSLGLPAGFAWERQLDGEAEGSALEETAGGWRALALLQIGQTSRAEAELRVLWPQVQSNRAVARALLVVASQANLSGLASQLAALQQSMDGQPRDYARFPVPRLQPLNGYRVDPSLLYALAMAESNFNTHAVSPVGARGLLQLMPTTASYLAKDPSLKGAGQQRLHEPGLGLELGQRYLHYLAQQNGIDGDLIRMLASYNAGPNAVARWQPASGPRDDPFLFIESIPVPETRQFVQRVLAYSWIYASRLGLPSPSLDRIAAGGFPRFLEPQDVARLVSAANRR